MSEQTGQWHRGFSAGVLAALYILHYAGEDTYCAEIIEACGPEALIAEARRAGHMRDSGLSDWLKEQRDREAQR